MYGPRVTRIAIVSEIRLLREGLAALLADRTPHAVIGTADASETLPSYLRTFNPDVVLVDAMTARRQDVTRCLRAPAPSIRLIAFAVAEETEDVLACVAMGVAGFVSRNSTLEDLLAAVDGALSGELRCSPRIAALMCAHLSALAQQDGISRPRLTAREREIAALISEGLSNKEIAHRLSLEVSTIKNHVHSLLDKLKVRHRWQVQEAAMAPISGIGISDLDPRSGRL
jgi:two-component system, NarL family, nitrate/nitrite response regulator NarL